MPHFVAVANRFGRILMTAINRLFAGRKHFLNAALLAAGAALSIPVPARADLQEASFQTCPHDSDRLRVPAGNFIMGSSRDEREFAYRLDRQVTRAYGWYEKETRKNAHTGEFCIDRFPVTNADYKAFIDETNRSEPTISRQAYHRQGFLVHPYEKVKEFLWHVRAFAAGTERHPVVLVSIDDARSYCAWKARKTGQRYRLPTEAEWEKAARGIKGRIFPWGDDWNPANLNSGNRFGSTTPVGRFPGGKSPYGAEEMAGNTFEWTDTPWDANNHVLKGCSWDDLPGTCRSAMRHGRPGQSRHILIGFRCVFGPAGLDLRQDAG